MIRRPGPVSIEAGECPGGIVFHHYSVPSEELLRVSKVGPGDDIEEVAGADAEWVFTLTDEVCLVVFWWCSTATPASGCFPPATRQETCCRCRMACDDRRASVTQVKPGDHLRPFKPGRRAKPVA